MSGPLDGLRVVELASIGPGPHGAMMLGDLGADVVRVERPGGRPSYAHDVMLRGRRSVVADLKQETGREAVLALAAEADVLIEGMRPGVAERLGVGPDACAAHNPGLVYARMTGWGQDGPLAPRAGHDINYIGVAGLLHAIGPAGGRPVPPLNLLGDYGGGSMLLVIGVLAALHERRSSGLGQVVDAAMVDGAALLGQVLWNQQANGEETASRGQNLLDGGAPFYDVHMCADGEYVAVGPLEERFYDQLVAGLGLSEEQLPDQYDRASWPFLRDCLATAFAARSRDEWVAIFDGSDACVTPVLALDEVAEHSHIAARGSVSVVDGVAQAAPAPRFSRSGRVWPPKPTEHAELADILRDWAGMDLDDHPHPQKH